MAIGDGENDMEMLELASLGVVMSNGAEKTKAVADVIGMSNDEDGVADAIYRYAFWVLPTPPQFHTRLQLLQQEMPNFI